MTATAEKWQADLAEGFGTAEELLRYLGLDTNLASAEAVRLFPFRVPRSYANRMGRGDAADPLLRQVLPLASEARSVPGFVSDPVGDRRAVVAPGLLHKYRGRVLLITSGACPIHCRYCFRREFPYGESQLTRQAEGSAIAYIEGNRDIEEVILSGGDPLLLGDVRLGRLFRLLETIPHLKRVRIHSRVPVVLPSRITRGLAEILRSQRLPIIVVIHANHPREIDAEVGAALSRLREAGVTLFNQAVLLRGVNDDEETLIRLSEALFAHQVHPYYLHVLDRVRGTAHFEVAEEHAVALYEALRQRLPGYLVPRLVRELEGEPYKVLL
ncbi:MAG TPA: EF-P beta-lysylation protein EpmB [Methylococcus sp.]|nr:EF-P beta-lysylation protein EpmB [Methylococcus sp.]